MRRNVGASLRKRVSRLALVEERSRASSSSGEELASATSDAMDEDGEGAFEGV